MLLTNGSSSSRETYAGDFLSTITVLPYQAYVNMPMGIFYVTMRTRFAGLHNPTVALLRQPTIREKADDGEQWTTFEGGETSSVDPGS